MMSLWNAANGPSIHAEMIGREWIRMGHQLTVFSSIRHPDARPTRQTDEDFVIRHFAVDNVHPFTRASFFNPTPLLRQKLDVFIAQNVERLPSKSLIEIFPKIKRRSVTVMVAHEGKEPEDPLYYKFNWDAIVCFDERYKDFLVKHFPDNTIHIIPYPCYPYTPGDKNESRKKLGIPLNAKVIFSFGFRAKEITRLLPHIKELTTKYPLKYIIIANPKSDVHLLEELKIKYEFVNLQVRPIPLKELYIYLYASDALLIHRESSQKYNAVISSSVCQALGSGCPILFHNSNFVDSHNGEIIKYSNFEDMKKKLIKIFQQGFDDKKVQEFLRERNSHVIANRFISLFKELLERHKYDHTPENI